MEVFGLLTQLFLKTDEGVQVYRVANVAVRCDNVQVLRALQSTLLLNFIALDRLKTVRAVGVQVIVDRADRNAEFFWRSVNR